MNWRSQWRESWRERGRQIWAAMAAQSGASLRQLAAVTGFSKSSIGRHQRAMAERGSQGAGELWELESGQEWLKLLFCAVIYLFGIQQGMGNEKLSEFFYLLHLERHIGVSATAIAAMRERIAQQILSYNEKQQAQLKEAGVEVEICGGADETFFEKMVLVLLDLSSGYILVETNSDNRSYETWQQTVEPVLGRLFKVKYLVSDRAKALVKLALDGLGCPSIADLFHALREISQKVGCHLGRQLQKVETQIAKVKTELEQRTVAGLATTQQQKSLSRLVQEQGELKQTQAFYHRQLQQLSLTVHPFALPDSSFQTSEEVRAALQVPLQALRDLTPVAAIPQLTQALDKFARQIPDLAAVINTWWSWVFHSLSAENLDPETSNWLTTRLLPLVYWQQQLAKTKSPALKTEYQKAYSYARQLYQLDPFTSLVDPTRLEHWYSWAEWMVSHFQRTSSPVEGRNGALSRLHHTSRGLSPSRLQVLTIIHNFALKRRDGSTAAQRLFGRPFPDLFESIVDGIGELPLPRKSRKQPSAQMPFCQAVPA